ncbi:MAG: hypothetical protein ACRDV9_15485, partial [Acidimicrobiia bacterium]
LPPLPPRQAGGPAGFDHNPPGSEPGRRSNATNPRANGTHPRAEEERAEAERERVDCERARAALDAQMAARRAETLLGAQRQAESLAEQLALSGVLTDELLVGVTRRVSEHLPGPLARSPFALAREVTGFCRRAQAVRPGDVTAAVQAALARDLERPGGGDGRPILSIPPAPSDTQALQQGIRALLAAAAESPSEVKESQHSMGSGFTADAGPGPGG